MLKLHIGFQKSARRLILLIMVVILSFAWLLPVTTRDASAAGQITTRKLTISSAVPADTNVTYNFTFTIPSTSQVQGLKFKACTTAVGTYPGGTCTAPTGMTGSDGFASVAFVSQSGWQGATNFAVDLTGANDCTASANIICATRTDTTSQTATSRTIIFNNIKNPTPNNYSFFVGISTYTSVDWSTAVVDFGATAAAVVQTLTTYAAVAEVLQFCVGSTTVDDADVTLIANDCTGVTGTSVNIGTLDTSQVNVSPVSTDGGDGNNGVVMLRTNASNGATVAYRAIPATTGVQHLGTLRISGATCTAGGGVFTDPCINAKGTTQGTFTAGAENFGMTIAAVNCKGTSSYTCTFAGATYNLVPQTNYIGNSLTAYGTTNGFAWDETGAATVIASSAASTVKQVDDEALVLKFAATPQITTPFGPYSVQTDFIAVPTY